jgi:WD40 repeat protein
MRAVGLRAGLLVLTTVLLLATGTVFVWQRTSHGNQIHLGIPWSPATVADLAISPDGRLLAAGTDHGLHVWQLPDRRLLWRLPDDRGNAVAWSPDGRFLASTSYSAYLHVWRIADRTLVAEVTGNAVVVDDLDWSRDGQWIAAAARGQGAFIWQVDDGAVVSALPALEHDDLVQRVVFSPDSRLLATNGVSAQFWSLPEGKSIRAIPDNPTALTFDPKGSVLAVSLGNSVQLRTIGDDTVRVHFPRQRDVVNAATYSPDGRLLAVGLGSRRENFGPSATTVQIWRVDDSTLVAKHPGHRNIVTAVAFTPDGRTLVSGSEDGTIRFWDVPQL